MSPDLPDLAPVIGEMPYRMALAGGWIDQPFVSARNPSPPGSMVVVNLAPRFHFMDRCGMGTSTRKVAQQLWGRAIPDGKPASLMRKLYEAENQGRLEPSGSQDMAGLIYSGINRLDYDASYEGGYFPVHVEQCNDQATADWLESVTYFVPVAQRPDGYSPLGIQNLDPEWIRRLGQTGKDCFQAILQHDLLALGASMNACMRCWEAILPQTVSHPVLTVDLAGLLAAYQRIYPGAMYSGCGGGYLIVASDRPVPGAFQVQVRTAEVEIL